MDRSTAEIKADIAVTRRLIETQLGVALSRVPLLRLVGTGARIAEAGLTVATTVSTVKRFIAERPGHRKAA